MVAAAYARCLTNRMGERKRNALSGNGPQRLAEAVLRDISETAADFCIFPLPLGLEMPIACCDILTRDSKFAHAAHHSHC
jgi:hypothetical protein